MSVIQTAYRSGNLRRFEARLEGVSSFDYRFFLVASFATGVLRFFSLSLIGQLPLAELMLLLVFGWALLSLLYRAPLACEVFQTPSFCVFITALVITLSGYVVADLYRESFMRDILRGWSRIAFLLIDVVAMVFLFRVSKQNTMAYLYGMIIGGVLAPLFISPLFGDYWKFGFASPVCLALLLFGPKYGRLFCAAALFVMAIANIALGYRSLGVLCGLLILLMAVNWLPLKLKSLALTVASLMGCLFALYLITRSGENSSNASRSNIQRQAMMQGAWEAWLDSPVIGHGSWFSRSHVVDNVQEIQWELAEANGVGGFARHEDGDSDMAIHSQLLVSLAEAGIVGAAFFIYYLGASIWGLWYLVIWRVWDPLWLVLVSRLWGAISAVFFSPFSGAARIEIAFCVAVILVIHREAQVTTRQYIAEAVRIVA